PILDLGDNPIAFGGRALRDQERAKYLNSPESVLFDKSSLLYGLHFAREAIVKSKQAVVVEGYLDALIPLQGGVENVVATLGTAMTERGARLLSRYAEEVVLIFDADLAGAAAAERALQLFIIQKLHVRVATIHEGKDPCDFCLAEGPDALRTLIDEAPDALEYVWDRRQEAFRSAGGNPAERNRLIEEFLSIIVSTGAYGSIDEVRQQSVAQHIAHVVNLPAIDLQRQMRRLRRQVRAQPTRTRTAQKSLSVSPERNILEVLLDRPDMFDDVARQVDPSHFHDAELATIAERIWAMGGDGRLSLEDLLAAEDMSDFAPVLTELSITGQRRGNHEQTLADAVNLLLNRRENREMQEIKARPMDDENLRRLQERFRKTDPRKRPGIQ
ncbi:MAG: toprim domain-containing protein, partial [Candidatus Hydrogenedentes bacterium]|nr:toprim domain-containing protein [Candidatus Hydrogenedentota bacterium]